MKAASTATKNILAAGQFYKAELYQFDLVGGTTLYFTNSDSPRTVAGVTYLTGLTIKRGAVAQKVGLEVQSLDLDITPQSDNPAGPITIGGAPFLSACRSGALDGARVKMSKLFLSSWQDTSPGAVPWYQGRVNQVRAGRFTATITVHDDIEILNIAMPRNVLQTGCVHTLFDAGCTLLKSSFQVSGSVSGSPTVLQFNTNLTQVNNYFDLGVITFTSGPNNGLSRVVKTYLNASGQITLIAPFPSAPASGNTFTIVPGCLKTQAACSNTNSANGPAFNNLTHFRGYPYVPVPETLYDGGTANGTAPSRGGQGGGSGGSAFSGSSGPGTYTP
jgi:uncharacterized phage protein (TIGR02218 family)